MEPMADRARIRLPGIDAQGVTAIRVRGRRGSFVHGLALRSVNSSCGLCQAIVRSGCTTNIVTWKPRCCPVVAQLLLARAVHFFDVVKVLSMAARSATVSKISRTLASAFVQK